MNVPASEELLTLPFDQYQRYQVAADIVELLGVPRSRPVIDVGGGPGFVEAFLPERDAVVVDVEGKHPGRFVLATGSRLPFADRTFTVGLALDTLEHVPVGERSDFLAEIRRVSDVVILSAPFADPSVVLAEAALHEFVLQRFGGPFPTLEEHAAHGLPHLDETVAAMGNDGWATATLPSGYLPRWLAGMLVHHELLAMGMPELPRLHAFYNATVSRSDNREPSYRHVVVAARELTSERLATTVDSLRSEGDDAEGAAALRAIAGATFAHRLGGNMRAAELAAMRSGEIEDLRAETHRLSCEVAERDGEIARLLKIIDELRADVEAARQEIVLEARRSISSAVLQRLSNWRARRRM